MANEQKHYPMKHSCARPTIGLLCDAPVNQYSSNMWAGVRDAASAYGVNLFYFAGGIPGWSTKLYPEQANVLYERISPAYLDGLVIWGALLSTIFGPEVVRTLVRQFRPLPMVSIGLELDDIPCILVDNYQGTYDLVTHLITVHGYRRIAYLDSPYKNLEPRERYRGYLDALTQHAIPFDQRLVTDCAGVTLNRQRVHVELGYVGAHVLFEERGLLPNRDVEALVTFNDDSAFEAVQFLKSKGFYIPEDIAVVGFDDIDGAIYHSPPLTTVRQSFYDQGWQAVELLIALLQGEAVSTQLMLPASLVIRRSCGCLDPVVDQAEISRDSLRPQSPSPAVEQILVGQRNDILSALSSSIQEYSEDFLPEWPEHLLDSFMTDIQHGSSRKFVATLERLLSQVMEAGADISPWHDVLSALRRHIHPYITDEIQMLRAEDLWQQGRVVIGKMAQRAEATKTLQAFELLNTLQATRQTLITTFDLPELMNFLVQELPRLQIPGGYIALYDDPEKPTGSARLILAYNETGRIDLEAREHSIPPGHVLPDNLLSQERPHSLVISALYFQAHQIGFVVFEAGQCQGLVHEVLRGEISTALYGALLVQRFQEHSAELARQKYILDTFIENVPARIYFKNRNGQIIRANKAHAARYGFSDPAEEIGKTDFDLHSPDHARFTAEQEQQILETGQPLLNCKIHSILPNEKESWSLVTKMPLRDEHGNIIGTFGISIDITQLKQTELALEHARKMAEEARRVAEAANHAKTEFLTNISHELRTPLNSILGHAQLLKREREPSAEALTEGLTVIQRSGEHLLTLINDILDLSKIEARKMELHSTPVNLPGFLAEIAETIRMRAEDKGMELVYEPDPDLPEGVLTDETRLRQVLLNLLGNAVKFTDQGTVTFRVKKLETQNLKLERFDSAHRDSYPERSRRASFQFQHRISFEIIDTGIGIPAEHLDRIFLPFEQVGDARFRTSGTGLGLTISQRIVKLMGGTIQVLSTVGTGSTFWVELILPEVQLSMQHPISPQHTIYGYRGPRQTALIIDDHPYNRQILHKLLESVGFTCMEAEHGEQGLALARVHYPRLMLVDLVMPVMDGIEFARKIRQIPSLAETVLVAISAGAFEHQIEQSRRAGYDAFLAKPVNIQEVLAVLETHLSLDWLYKDFPTDIPERVTDRQPMIVPPPDTLQVLHELTLKGDLFGIKVEVDRLREIHAAYGPFFNKVRQLADQYQDLKLLNFLEHALKKQETTSSMYE